MTKIAQHSFLGGQLDWEMMGRQDVEKYRTGATLLKNAVLHKRGAAFKRPGTDHLADVTVSGATAYRLVPFAYAQDEGWALLFTDGAIRAYSASCPAGVAVTAGTGASAYAADQLADVDYCPCGDVVYLAHPDKPPQMIAHVATVTNGVTTHAFTLSKIDFTEQGKGKPAIDSAKVSKMGVTYQGPKKTEAYRVTAVYDGVETFASPTYSNDYCGDYDNTYKKAQDNNNIWGGTYMATTWTSTTKSYSGTAYTLPWTESQKIALTLTVPSKPVDDTTVHPEQLRIYRKSGSSYGLVGIVNLEDEKTVTKADATSVSSVTRIQYNGKSNKGNSAIATNIDDFGTFGLGYDGFEATGALTLALSSSVTQANVNLRLGCLTYEDHSGLVAFYDFDEGDVFNKGDIATITTETTAEVDGQTVTTSSTDRYVCLADGTTGTFDPTKWQKLNNSSFSELLITTYNPGDTFCISSKYYVCLTQVTVTTKKTSGQTAARENSVLVNSFREYSTTTIYSVGDYCMKSSKYYQCKESTSGTFDSSDWQRLSTSFRIYTYRSGGASSFKIKLGSGDEATEACTYPSTEITLQIFKNYNEGGTAFNTRATQEAEVWASKIGDTSCVSARVTAETASNTVTITPQGSVTQFHFHNVTASGESKGSIPSEVTWEDTYYTPDVSLTPPEDAGVMQKAKDYPSSVCLSQQRLIWGGTRNDPSRVMMSEIGAFYTHNPHQVQVADDAIDFNLAETQFPKINHIVELRKLIAFTGNGEWIIDSASANSGITFETVRATKHSCIGSSATLKPLVCNNVLLFAERTGQAVRQYGYELEDDGFGGNDISVFAQSIFNEKKIVAWAYQQHPHSTCWCVLSDGTLASLTFNREQQCIAWATHELGGGGLVRDIVCTQAVIGNDATIKDTSEILLLVQRGSAYCLERFRPESRDAEDTPAHFVCMDGVKAFAHGGTRRSGTTLVDLSTMRTATATAAGGSYAEGFAFDTRITTVYPVVADEVGMSQLDVKNVQGVGLRLMRSVGGKVKNATDADGAAVSLAKTALPTVSGGTATLAAVDERVLLASSNNRDGRITVFQDGPWPFGVTRLETDVETEEHR